MQPLSPGDQNKPLERMTELSLRKWLILRLIIACLFGGVIVFFSLRAGYDAAKYISSSYTSPQFGTQACLKQIIAAIGEYQRSHGTLPRTLDQLHHDPPLVGISIQDAWGQPLVYTVYGTDYSVTSYGQDGKPGGTGWDMDLTLTSQAGDFHFVHSLPTFRQYLTASIMQNAIWTAWITGLLAAILCFVSLKPRPLTRRSIAGLLFQTGVIFVAAVLVGGIITELHVPSGH